MRRIMVSDVFGKTPELEELAAVMPGEVELVDPYDGKRMGFNSEAEAYAFFCSEVGLDAYTNTLAEKVSTSDEQVSLLGFSVGASAIWTLSDQASVSRVSGAVGFYGSQIRHCSSIEPMFPVYLIFPREEQHFAVSELIDMIETKQNVAVFRTGFLHGFMNPHSPNYYHPAYRYYVKALRAIPSRQCFHLLAL